MDLSYLARSDDFKFKRAFSSLGCGEHELQEVIAIAQRHEIPCVELRTLGGMVDLPGYFAARHAVPEKLADLMDSTSVRIVSLGTSLRLIGNTAESREAFIRYVPWAEACGASTLRVFDGGTSGSVDEIECARSTLRWWQELRADNGWKVDIAIETHDAFAIEENLLRFLDGGVECQVLWDAHHTWRKGGADPVRTWAIVRDNVRHIHVKDSVASAQKPAGYAYVLPGDGEFPMSALLSALRADGYDGVLSLEWERHWHPELPQLDAALSAARERSWW
ncbi:TIM barrel protein [Paraburkholderia sp. 1N]|uniref:TIM barrel protein n=1 Tax=Paraburkholderia solitsugae TaxID=2675748 RepID=A0ABX2BPU0_9BURK|nr:TIM barrel protein [Paraburkholderia solitsugae]NPT42920.1 TIM barrel protein [Paraburkholderia solitsugae]